MSLTGNMTVLAIFDALTLGVLLLYFLHGRHRYIQVRRWEFSICLIVVALTYYHVLAVDLVMEDLDHYMSCELLGWAAALFIPMFSLTFMLRATLVVVKFYQQLEIGNFEVGFFSRNQRLLSLKSHLLFYLGCSVVVIIATAAVKYTNPLPYTHAPSPECVLNLIPVLNAEVAVVLVFLVGLVVACWKIEDAFYIKLELKLISFSVLPPAVVWMIGKLVDFLPFSSIYLVHAIIYLSFLCSFVFPLVMVFLDKRALQSFKRRRSLITPAQSDNDKMREICKDPALFKRFKAMCVRAWCVENLLFYQQAMEYKGLFATLSEEERKEKAWSIYTTFVKVQARLEVNIEMTARETVFEALSAGNYTEGLFDSAAKHVFSLLRYGVFKDFSQTKEFRERFPEEEVGADTQSTFELGAF